MNEITNLTTSVGSTWATPAYDLAGNMTTIPQPAAPAASFAATYDAWHRLMGLSASGSLVATYQYDGLKRRTVKDLYSAGTLVSTRHFFDSSEWQVLEERRGTTTTPDRQFVWGVRYIDDIVLRDRDPNGIGSLSERLYGMQDPNWNLTLLCDPSGTVQERYVYDPYGNPTVLSPAFVARSGSLFDWEVRYAGYHWETESGLYQVRNRMLHPVMYWLQRDPLGLSAGVNLYEYAGSRPLVMTDPQGLVAPLVLICGAACAGCVLHPLIGLVGCWLLTNTQLTAQCVLNWWDDLPAWNTPLLKAVCAGCLLCLLSWANNVIKGIVQKKFQPPVQRAALSLCVSGESALGAGPGRRLAYVHICRSGPGDLPLHVLLYMCTPVATARLLFPWPSRASVNRSYDHRNTR